MRLPRRSTGIASLLAAVGLAACYHPEPLDGALLCGYAGECPRGYHCAFDGTCYRDGYDPKGDGSAPALDLSARVDLAVVDLHPPSDLRMPDLRSPPDLSPLPNGVGCRADGECTSGFCTDGVCCAVRACQGACTSCAAGKGLACDPVPAGLPDPRGQCVDDAASCRRKSCDGKGGCQPALAGTACADAVCMSGRRAAARSCDGITLGCPNAAPPVPCANRFVCADARDCAVTCAGNGDCAAGACCRNGVCYDDTLAGSCGAACLDCGVSAAGRLCLAGSCGCGVDNDCNGIAGKPRCDAKKKTCVTCATAFDCTPIAPVCSAGSCAACGANADCTGSGWGVTCGNGTCACTADGDCKDASGRARRCDNLGRCVCGMTGAPCPVGRFCSDATANATCL